MDDKTIALKKFPPELFKRAKAKAALLGITVSELFKRAIEKFLK
jgi:hypothetical protein